MSAAPKVLHLAIEDAVQQLEPQLLPLFGTGRHQRDVAVKPTIRTQIALKMLVALTRFFPEEHRVRKAGRQLELIWPPLVHEPRGPGAGRLLHYYFRLRQDLLATPDQALRRAMRDMLRSAVEDVQVSGDTARGAECERRLHQLAGFLAEPVVDTVPVAPMSQLARLFIWQQALELQTRDHADHGAVSPALLPDMLTVLDQCTALCRASDWSLDFFCNSGLARSLWQLRGMTRFGGNAAMAELFEELDDDCLDMHLAGSPPQAGLMQQWLARLFEVVHAASITRPPAAETANMPELPFRAIYDNELMKYRQQLLDELQGQLGPQAREHPEQALRVSAPLITLLYKLTWVFAAAEQHDWARLCHCAYRVALQFWRIRRPVTPVCQAMLCNLAHKPGTLVPAAVLRHWRWQLLQNWPNWAEDAKRPIALHAAANAVVTLDAVPDLLSGSFTALVQAGRLTERPSADACRPYFQILLKDLASELLQELALLEKGAAAMKVWPLEQLCTLLIAVYETHLREQVELPVALMQRAHRQVVRMLDQAAAWHEVQFAEGLAQELEQWLHGSAGGACREPLAGVATAAGTDSIQTLRAHLLSCLGTLASVLERPVRLHLDAEQLHLDAARLTQVVDCLRPLIKFMLLDQSVDARSRYAMHKPRVSTLTVSLRATSATLVVTAGEDSHEDVLAPSELQRLQRRLPKLAGPLVCESHAGRGRSFTFTLN